MTPSLKLRRRRDGWWIVGDDNDREDLQCGPYSNRVEAESLLHRLNQYGEELVFGPYETKAEAEDDRRGLELFCRHEDPNPKEK